MKIGEFFVSLGVKGDTKELDKTNDQLDKADKKSEKLNKTQNKTNNGFKALRSTVLRFTGGLTLAYNVVDRMAMSLAKANQQMINFQRQTGLSFATLNKYASASASVNANATIEGTAQSLQRVAQNLWDIRLGRGDISPYQELAFIGGKAFNPAGMSVEEVIENLREAIKNVDDIPATNIITRMGFSPDDLLMLRMSRQELEEINSLFLDAKNREALYKYGLEMKKLGLQIELTRDKVALKLMPAFIEIKSQLKDSLSVWGEVITKFSDFISNSEGAKLAIKGIGLALAGVLAYFHPVIASITALYILLEDLTFWYLGKKSLFGELFGDRGSQKFTQSQAGFSAFTASNPLIGTILNTAGLVNKIVGVPNENNELLKSRNILGGMLSKIFTQNNEINITTTEKADRITANNIIEYTALANRYAL